MIVQGTTGLRRGWNSWPGRRARPWRKSLSLRRRQVHYSKNFICSVQKNIRCRRQKKKSHRCCVKNPPKITGRKNAESIWYISSLIYWYHTQKDLIILCLHLQNFRISSKRVNVPKNTDYYIPFLFHKPHQALEINNLE